MLTPLAPGVEREADHLGRRHASAATASSRSRTGSRSRRTAAGTTDVYVNHETSLVPFPATAERLHELAWSASCALNQHSAGVLRGELRDPERARTTSASARTSSSATEQGFERELILFTNEEATRHRQPRRARLAGRSPPTELGAEQAGVVVALRRRRAASTGRSTAWAGTTTRTASAIPGYGHPVVLSGDDTFDAPGVAALPRTRRERRRRLERRGDALRVRRPTTRP